MSYEVDPIPPDCPRQISDLGDFAALAAKTPADIVAHFRANAQEAQKVLWQSYDKRYTPSTFIEEKGKGYSVGWYDQGYAHVRRFDDFAEALADYLLFSFGKGRLTVMDGREDRQEK